MRKFRGVIWEKGGMEVLGARIVATPPLNF